MARLNHAAAFDPPIETGHDELSARLRALFEEQELFLIAGLTLKDIAQRLGVKSYLLSRTVNSTFGTSFPAFVNFYRLERAKALLRDTPHKTLAVALESGFSNNASFHRTFKRAAGMTPSQYRERARNR